MKKINGKPIRFCRWGGWSSVNQKGYNPAMPTFHCPPYRRGIYAFVWPYIERFLLTGFTENQHKYKKGTVLEDYGDGLEEREEEYYQLCPPRIFDYSGYIWHHLGSKLHPTKILSAKGSWFLTNCDNYVEALRKELHTMKSHHRGNFVGNTNNPAWGWAKDHLEVFIEKV